MLLPRGDEYIAAVQNPRSAFNDAELRGCTPESDKFGIPKPYSGGFTATFHMSSRSREWAVRCFTRAISDLQERYAAIDQFLNRSNERFFVGTFYLSQGIRIGGQWYPIIKMQWVKGETLNAFIDKNIGNAGRIKALVPEFLALVQRLQQLKIAHGDLQHGNIVVRDGKMVLIDYDGMFLPRLARLKTNEIGHPNYQHPGRSAGHYDIFIDHFASIVIYLGLRGIAETPKLWSKYSDGENVLFREEDFVDLARSALLRDLAALPALSADVDKFRGVCKMPFADVPDLETFIAGRFRYPEGTRPLPAAAPAASTVVRPAPVPTAVRSPFPPRAPAVPAAPQAPPPAPALKAVPGGQKVSLDGANVELLKRYVGQRVEVVGSVAHYHVSGKGFSRPFVLLNFGGYPDHTFTVVLRDRALKAFQRSGVDPQVFVGKRVKVFGVLAGYKGKPQMEVEGPAQIQVVGGGAVQHLASVVGGASVPRPSQRASSGPPESVFDTLYAGRTVSPSAAKATPARAPAPRLTKAPARGPTPRSAKAPAARVPRTRRAGKSAPGLLVALLFIVALGVMAWVVWSLWAM